MVKIIAICGLRRSGKDTIAQYVQENYNYKHVKISSTLKQTCALLFGFSHQQMEDKEKDIVDQQIGITPRLAMQFLGTEVMQYKIQEILPNVGRCFWIDLLIKNFNDDQVVISDLRFVHEYEALKKKHNLYVIKVCKTNPTLTQDTHPSEIEWLNIPENITIENNGSYQELYKKVNDFISTIS